MKNCFGYVRVSSLRQGEGVSLDAQKDAIERFAGSNEISIVQWFEEQQTAAKSGRPVFNGMLKALKAGKASGVVMHKIDRSARNFFDWAKIGELADSGIDVHFATESLDFRSRGGRLTANIQMAVAEDYVRNLRAEVLKGQLGQLERGFFPFGAPFGYRNNGKHALKTIDPVKGRLVKKAFQLYATGQYSLDSLRHEMVKHGLMQSSGNALSKGRISSLLTNPFYAGVIHIKSSGAAYKGAHKPLISGAVFQRVQDVKAGRTMKKQTRHNHLFRGLFMCGSCNWSMTPERQKGHVYYRCHNADCPKNCVREEQLNAAVLDFLNACALPEHIVAEIDQRFAEWQQQTAQPDNTIAMQLVKLEERMAQLEDAAIAQIIDKDSFNSRKEKILLEKVRLENEQHKGTEFHRNPAVVRAFLELIKNLAGHYQNAEAPEKREILEIALSNRYVNQKYVSVEPSKWLRDSQNAVGVLTCPHPRTTSRTSLTEANRDEALKQLATVARSPEVERLLGLFMEEYQNVAFRHYPTDARAA